MPPESQTLVRLLPLPGKPSLSFPLPVLPGLVRLISKAPFARKLAQSLPYSPLLTVTSCPQILAVAKLSGTTVAGSSPSLCFPSPQHAVGAQNLPIFEIKCEAENP